MTSVRRLAVVLMACCAAGALIWLVWPAGGVPVNGAKSASTAGGSQSKDALSLGSFVVPGMQEIDGDQQALDAERARARVRGLSLQESVRAPSSRIWVPRRLRAWPGKCFRR